MTKIEAGLKLNFDERGYTGENWRLKVLEINPIGQSDFVKIYFKTFPPKTRKGYGYEITVNMVRNQIHWDTMTTSYPDRY